jgi:hypothetical protein
VEQPKAPRPEPDLGARLPVFSLGHAPLLILRRVSDLIEIWHYAKTFELDSGVSDIQRFSSIGLCGTAIAF